MRTSALRLVVVASAAALAVASALALGAFGFGDAAPARVRAVVAKGDFTRLAHPTRGTATVVELSNGSRRLLLRDFSTRLAPDLFVYVVPGSSYGERISQGTKVSRLRFAVGNQAYDLPEKTPLKGTVVIWCALCSSAWGRAELHSA